MIKRSAVRQHLLLALPSALLATLALACDPPAPDVSQLDVPIVDGTFEEGEDAVVTVLPFGGVGLCTGTLIAPNVVLTAKHCVQAADADAPYPVTAFTVGVGSDVRSVRGYRARYVETTPGAYSSNPRTGLSGAIIGVDVGVLILRDDVEGVTPIPIRRDEPRDMIGQTFTAVGFGQRPDGPAGLKYKGDGVISNLTGGVLYTEQTICQGDSGGPMIQEAPERRVIGVASFGQAGSCPSAADGYNSVYQHLDLIDRALVLAGQCLGGEEVCNGLDDDCDDATDEGCADFGEACEADTDCAYAQLPDFLPPAFDAAQCLEGVCARPCNPLAPSCDAIERAGVTIPTPGLYCQRTSGCEGRCVAGSAGSALDGTDCASDGECASGHCVDPGDGRRRCLPLCVGDAGHCPVGEACAATPEACGACVDAGLVVGGRGIGEPCASHDDCHGEGVCEDGACTRACTTDTGCPDGFHCAASLCARGGRGRIGDPCEENDDCGSGFCASAGDRSWCSRFCDAAEDCADGFACTTAGAAQVCAPEGALFGESCSADANCGEGGICSGGACTRSCGAGASCPLEHACTRDDEGRAVCGRPSGGGCAASPGPSSSGAALALLLGLLALVRRRPAGRRKFH